MPKRRSSNNSSDLWVWLAIAVIVVIIFSVVLKYIEENAWVRWIIFAVFTSLFVISVRDIFGNIRKFIVTPQMLFSVVSAIFSFMIFHAQTDFFTEWWEPGIWLVNIFNTILGIWLLYLVIRLIWEWWNRRRQGFL